MNQHIWRAAIAIGCMFVMSCHGKKNQVQVVSRNFESEIEQQQNLVFNFNKDLYPDSLLQHWDSTAFIEFSPKVRGLFRWNSSSELVFSPVEGFKAGTEYTARLTKQLVKKSKVKLWVEDEPMAFHTAPLRVVNTHLSWTRGQSMANVMVQLDLDFNYDIKVPDVATHLKLSNGGTSIISSTINNGTGKTVSLQFMPLNEQDEQTPLKIELSKGIPIAAGNYTTKQDTIINTFIPSRYNMEVTGVSAQHTGTEGIITVNTSQPVKEENLKSFISIEPSVAFDLEVSDAGFIITSSSLLTDQTYSLTVSQKMEGAFGGRMKKDHFEQVTFGKLEPSISFANTKGMYLSTKGFRNLALNIVNVASVELTVVKVYENNIEQFFRSGRDYDYGYDEEENYHSYSDYNTANLGDIVFQKEYATAKLPRLNAARVLHLDFSDKIKGYDGLYVINVRSKDEKWISQSKILSLSDIGLIVKEEKNKIYVFANSIRNATPISGAKISFISTNNQKLFTANTDDEGVAVFENINTQAPGFSVGLITAKMNSEFSFVWMQQSKVETSRFDVGGRYPNAVGLNAMIYAERNLYRPGETIHVSTIVRDEAWNSAGEVPVKLKLTMPNGKDFATMRKILNEEGGTETSFNMPPTAMTGTYTLSVLTGNDVLLNNYNISIEEFMPDRIKASLKIDKEEYRVGDSIKASVQADNLFGTPAANRNYELELNISKTQFSPKNFQEFDFSIRNDFNFSAEFKNGQTNNTGAGKASFLLKDEMKDVGMLQGNVMATVFDETGRPVHRFQHFTVYTQPVFAGVKLDDYYVGTRKPMRVGLIALDKNSKPQNASLHISFIRKEWQSVIEQNGSSYRYVSRWQERILEEKDVNVSGANSSLYFKPDVSGEYEMRVAVKGSNSYISHQFYAWGWTDTRYTSFEVNTEGNVDMKMDKEKYKTGEDINVLFTTPFEGRLLVTVERDKVIRYAYLNTQNKSASFKLKADDACVPNVYISATLVRPMDGNDMPLTVAHGFKSVSIENPKNHLPVTVSISEKSRSKTKQTISVKTAPNAYVTIAAVDEGILQIKNYETPDAYKYFYQKVALSTNSYDIYPLLLPEVKYARSSTGGDGADESAMRVNPIFVNRVKNVSFWSGIMRADGNGLVKYNIDIPQFSGDLRVMAVAYKGKGFGGADNHMKVADPIVISAALPRFLSPKDEVIMPVTISNTTTKATKATVSVIITGALTVKESSVQTVTIPANNEGRTIFRIAAQQAIGAAKVTVNVKALNETFTNETEMSIRPPASLQKVFNSGLAAAGNSTGVDISNQFIPSTARGKLVVSKSPLVQFSKNISDLVHYPYGCVEQTTSAAFPQLYYADMVKSISGKETTDPNPAYNVQQAVLKLQSMQLSNGALSYWPGNDNYESWFGSVYASHFLLEAKKAGYDVNAQTVERLLTYLKYRLNKKETEPYYYNDNLKKIIASKDIPYSLYVLALAHKPELSTMNYYKAHADMLSLDGKYLLAAAYALSGQQVQAKQVLPPAFDGERSKGTLEGSFYSYIRDEAISLNALLEINPNDPQVSIMAKHLVEQMKKQYYLNTQENAWSILAFGKIARAANKTNATANILVDGKTVVTTKGDNINLDLKPYMGKALKIQVAGTGAYYFFAEASGITSDGSFKQEDSYMKIRRSFYDRSGNEISNLSFKQNDLIIVRLSLEGQYSSSIENVAITDMLPAGFEIENSRLSEMPEIKWIRNEAKPDYMDVRDDRINLFTSASGSRKDFYYMVRAVSPGEYQLGPVQADAMYNGSYHSYHGAGIVKISQ